MATSDSEAFESADEDLSEELPVRNVPSANIKEEVNSEQTKAVVAKSSADEHSSDITHESNAQKQKKKREKERTHKETTKLATKLIKNKLNTELQQTVKSISQQEKIQTTKSDDGWENFDVESLELCEDVIEETVEDKLIKTDDKMSDEKECNEQGDEGWDFDDWGEEDIQSHVAPKPETVHSEQEFKELADKLSSLGSSGGKASDTPGGWGGWGGWGASLISSGVSQLTTHVSQGFTTVSNVIESGMGAPDPEELVRIQKESKMRREEHMKKSMSQEKSNETTNEGGESKEKPSEAVENQRNIGGFQLGKIVSSVTKLVETTGSTVITGGLDTLEEIGKRTMKVIQGDEPGGRVKLSTLLREAKDRKEEQDANTESGDFPKKKHPHFEVLFDDYQGLVHLEALEMLSKQCDIKIQTLASKCLENELKELHETLEQVKEICELPDYEGDFDSNHDVESFHQQLIDATKDLGIKLSFELIINCWKELFESINKSRDVSDDNTTENNLEDDIENISGLAIKYIAQFSALSVQLLHKCAALLSVRERRSTADEADGLTQLTAILSHHIGEIANVYTSKLNKLSEQCTNSENVTSAMTTVYLEAEKGSSYVKDAFLLTIPILQVGAT